MVGTKREDKIEFVDDGYVGGVYMTSRTAYYYWKMLEKSLDQLIDGQFAGRRERESVKLYIEAQERKIKEAKKIGAKYENGVK